MHNKVSCAAITERGTEAAFQSNVMGYKKLDNRAFPQKRLISISLFAALCSSHSFHSRWHFSAKKRKEKKHKKEMFYGPTHAMNKHAHIQRKTEMPRSIVFPTDVWGARSLVRQRHITFPFGTSQPYLWVMTVCATLKMHAIQISFIMNASDLEGFHHVALQNHSTNRRGDMASL